MLLQKKVTRETSFELFRGFQVPKLFRLCPEEKGKTETILGGWGNCSHSLKALKKESDTVNLLRNTLFIGVVFMQGIFVPSVTQAGVE